MPLRFSAFGIEVVLVPVFGMRALIPRVVLRHGSLPFLKGKHSETAVSVPRAGNWWDPTSLRFRVLVADSTSLKGVEDSGIPSEINGNDDDVPRNRPQMSIVLDEVKGVTGVLKSERVLGLGGAC